MRYSILFISLIFILISCNSTPESPDLTAPSRTAPKVDKVNESIVSEDAIIPFSSKKGRFSISFPGEPNTNSHKTASEFGEIELHQFMYSEKDTRAWTVSYSDYPDKMIRLGNSEQLLKGIKYRIVEELHAKTLSEEQVQLDKLYKGLSFVAHSKKKKLDILYRIYLVKNRIYQISMYSSIGVFSPKDSANFIGSFKLLEENPS